ncbi:MAG: hypothetical protein LBP23_09570 [Treponema sp.]|nr:hypothetical protein [Treponema sp.]
MGSFIQALAFVTIGAVLLWFGYTLFFSLAGGARPHYPKRNKRKRRPRGEGVPGAPQTCPVCSARLEKGELVKSVAFPSFTGKDRLMYIRGCIYCLDGDRARICPVCRSLLRDDEFLVCRMFDRPGRSHVHVLGCSRCRRPGKR